MSDVPFVPLVFPPWIRWGQRRGAFVDNVVLRDHYPDHKLWTHRPDGTMGYVGAVRRCGWCATPCSGRRTAWCSDVCSENFYRVWSWRHVSYYVAERDGFRCTLCPLDFDPTGVWKSGERRFSYRAWECDHIVPVRNGGTDDPANLRTLCHDCHLTAGYEQRAAERPPDPQLTLEVA